jgi:DNA-binding PadR family transcriptional regulator
MALQRATQHEPDRQHMSDSQRASDTQHESGTARLSPTGRVILGMIASGKQTGYDIKQLVDKSTRHFWAASYGQIYPELRRLEEQGLIRGASEPSGGRARTVYTLTDAGLDALLDWLRSDEEPVYELRDEGMLKLFFSDALPEQRIANIRAMRLRQQRKLEQLRAIEPMARQGRRGAYLTLQLGIGSTEWFIAWCEEAERRLAESEDEED